MCAAESKIDKNTESLKKENQHLRQQLEAMSSGAKAGKKDKDGHVVSIQELNVSSAVRSTQASVRHRTFWHAV
jgi:hypothetical protein